MKPHCNSMILSDIILFGSLFAFIEFQEKTLVVTLNTFSKTLSEITENYCVAEYPGDSVSVIT